MKHQKDVVIGEIEKRPNSIKIRFFWYVGLFTFLIAVLAIIAAWPVVVILATYLAYAVSAIVAIVAIAGGLYLAWLAWHTIRHKVRRDEAITRKLENESSIITHDHNHVAYTFSNGQLFPIYTPQLKQSEMLQLASGNVQTLDFLEVMTKPRRCYSIVADQQTGKTTLAHYLVEYWMKQGIKPIVIAQKYDFGEYAHCEQFGPDSDSIVTGFDLVKQEAQVRQQLAKQMAYGEMNLQPVFLEDFTSFASLIGGKELESFVSQALTVFAARGLLLYFIVHSRVKGAFGLGRQGASLKDQMTRLEIIPAYHHNGEIDHAGKKVVCSIGSNLIDVPVTGIPHHRPRLDYDCTLSLYSLQMDFDHKPQPSRLESSILRRYDQGQGISQIATSVFGQQNGYNTSKVKAVLEKFGREIRDARVREEIGQ
ncbi:MAG: hypothetical protein JW953_08975 [Anaerolineae bacterium]|nr:hypothetical protein [Anaerolineae bacterium]